MTGQRWLAAIVLGACGLAMAGCGDDGGTKATGDDPGSASDGGSDPTTVYETDAIVLESPEHGPQMCNYQLDSYPPQCGGPDLVGWDWADVEGEESANGTTWGNYHVTGTWDPDAPALTITEPTTPPSDPPGASDMDFASPCPRPDGGWAPVDPAATNQATLDAATTLANARPGTAGVWVDQDAEPGWAGMNDPNQLVLNVQTTGDVAALESDLRAVWGGALCVSAVEHSTAELQEIAASIEGPNVLVANTQESQQTVIVDVYVPDDAMQAGFDDEYGDGVVRLVPWLTPVSP